MRRNDLGLVLTVLGYMLAVLFAGVYLGRKAEQRYVADHLPAQMDKLCRECAGIHVSQQ